MSGLGPDSLQVYVAELTPTPRNSKLGTFRLSRLVAYLGTPTYMLILSHICVGICKACRGACVSSNGDTSAIAVLGAAPAQSLPVSCLVAYITRRICRPPHDCVQDAGPATGRWAGHHVLLDESIDQQELPRLSSVSVQAKPKPTTPTQSPDPSVQRSFSNAEMVQMPTIWGLAHSASSPPFLPMDIFAFLLPSARTCG